MSDDKIRDAAPGGHTEHQQIGINLLGGLENGVSWMVRDQMYILDVKILDQIGNRLFVLLTQNGSMLRWLPPVEETWSLSALRCAATVQEVHHFDALRNTQLDVTFVSAARK